MLEILQILSSAFLLITEISVIALVARINAIVNKNNKDIDALKNTVKNLEENCN